MPGEAFDRRLTPARADLAAAHLRGTVEAERFADGQPYHVGSASAPMRPVPDPLAAYDTELLMGEDVTVYDITPPFAWCQSALDGYVGYVPLETLSQGASAPTHIVHTLTAQTYRAPSLKLPPQRTLPFGARLALRDEDSGYARTADDQWIALQHIRPLDRPEADWVAVAERFVGVPYVWGGRSAAGLDCSGLVQLARQAGGHDCPRDSDMQAAALGETLSDTDPPARGDLVFWKGHVGILHAPTMLLHANAHHRCVTIEPLEAVKTRVSGAGDGAGAIMRRARLDVRRPKA